MSDQRPVHVALTIAGSDSGGGAGIQADLKTFSALGVYGMSAITAITAQNTLAVARAVPLAPDLVAAQMDAVMEDIGCDAAKTGMLANTEIVEAVAARVATWRIKRLVVDPVMIAKSGDALLADEACSALREKILPLALVVTPNLHEAGALLGREVETLADMTTAAREIADMGPAAVVIKGGHLAAGPTDILYVVETGEELVLEGRRVDTTNTHGTGCTFSAAIAAHLAQGAGIVAAVMQAKRFVSLAIEHSLDLGAGHGPTGHIEAGRRMANPH